MKDSQGQSYGKMEIDNIRTRSSIIYAYISILTQGYVIIDFRKREREKKGNMD